MFNEPIQVDYVYNAHKPSTKNYRKAMEIMETDETNSVFIGDQLFTDVWGAKRTGISNILVKPIHPKRRDSDCAEEIFGEDCVVFLCKKQETGEKIVEKRHNLL